MRLFIIYITLLSCTHLWSQSFNSDTFWTQVEVQNLAVVNSEYEEFSPFVYKNQLIYVGKQDKGPIFRRQSTEFYDLKMIPTKPGSDQYPIDFSKNLNGRWHEGPISFMNNGKTILYTRANQNLDGMLVDSYDRLLLQIYQADFIDGKWRKIRKFIVNRDDANYCHPAISDDGNTMVFASTQDLTLGKMDLFVSYKKGTKWTKEKNLGPEINTEYNEWFPYFFENNHLFYASDRKDGNGMDIYYCKIQADGTITDHYRLPKPFNTRYDDFGFYLNKDRKTGYFSSDRPGGKGKDDIYQFSLKTKIPSNITSKDIAEATGETIAQPDMNIQMKIVDNNSLVGLADSRLKLYIFDKGGSVEFLNLLSENAPIKDLESLASQQTSPFIYASQSNGKTEVEVPRNKQVFIVVEKIGYQSEWNYIHTRHNIESLVFELNKN